MASGIQRWAHKQVFRPTYRAPVERLALRADDGTRIHAVRVASTGADPVASVVLVHGFTNSSRTPTVHAFAQAVCTWAHVVVPDLRGHGKSAGVSSLGSDEPLDVAAAARAAHHAAPDLPIVFVGTSLGGLACLLAAAQPPLTAPAEVAGVVAVSAPAYRELDLPDAARMLRWCVSPVGRLALRIGFRTRVAGAGSGPDDVAPLIAHLDVAFTIIAHDPGDRYFGPGHATALADAITGPKELWWLPGAGHGGDVLTPAFANRVEGAVRRYLAGTET